MAFTDLLADLNCCQWWIAILQTKSLLLPFGNADAVRTSCEVEFASALRRFGRPVSEFTFTGTSRRAAAAGIRIGGHAVTAAASDPMRTRCKADPQVAITLPLSGTGKLITKCHALEWTASKAVITNSFHEALEVTTDSTGTLISLCPSNEKLLSVLRGIIRDRGARNAEEADAILARLLVRGPVIDTGRSWSVDYFSAIMNVVALMDDCQGDHAMLERIGLEDVICRLLARMVLDQEQGAGESEPAQMVTRSTRAVDLICDRIRDSIGTPMSMSDMEELTGLTGRALGYAFRARFDCSPQEWQRNFLLDHSRQLLKDRDFTGSIKSLAYELGFSSPGSFTAFYRQRFGERPSETLAGHARRMALPALQDSLPADE
jgi:AraC-like DNA-binding protein